MKALVMFAVRWEREEIPDPQRLLETVASLPLLDVRETDDGVYVGHVVASASVGETMYVPDMSERERGIVEGMLESTGVMLGLARTSRPIMTLIAYGG